MFDSIKKGIKSAYKKGKKAVTNLGKRIFGGSSSSGGSSTHRSSSGSTHGGSSGTTHGGSSGSFGRNSYVSRSPRYSGPAARSYSANTVTNQARSGVSRSSAGVNQISRNSSAYNSSTSTSYNSRRGSRSDTTHNSNSGSFADRNPHALSTDAKKNQEEVAGNIKRFGAGVGKRYFGSQMYGLKDSLQDAYKAYMRTGLPGSREIPIAAAIDKFAYEKTVGKANKNLSLKHLDSVTDRVLKKYGSKLQESGEKDIEDLKKNSGTAGKWGIDLAAGAAELGLDVGLTLGRGTMAAMYNRAYGSAKKTAIDEGATEKQAKLYGQVIGGIEAGTEKISSVAAPLRKLYGKGATDELTDRVIDKIVSKTTSKAGKNIAYHGAKTVASAIGEGLEEMVSEGLDPVIANTIYANAVGKPHSTSAKDVLYAGSIGAALGGVLGGGGQVVEYNRGKKVLSAAENNMFGEGGIKSLINEAKTADEDTGDNVRAQAYDELVNTGQGIVAGQANELYSSVQSQRARDDQRYGIAMRASDNMIKKNGYVPVVGVDNEGNAKISDNTRSTYEKYSAFNTEVIKGEMQLPEAQSKEIAAAVSEIQTGIADTSTVNMFTTANPEARTAYERITGETLPDTNQGTRAYLYEKLAENRVESARAETEYFKDTMKGLIQQDVTPTYDTAGQEAFSRGMENVNVGNGNDVSNYIVSFEHFYEAGRTGLEYSDVAKTKNPAYESVSGEIKKSAYEAGVRDRIDGADNVKGMQIKIGQTLKESRSNERNKARRGKVISELSKEGKKRVSASAQAVYRTLARTFNLEIHLVEDIAGTNANGFYKDGVMYLNINADRPLSYVFSHEITHHMQQYAPEQYAMFKQLVREKWFQQGGIEDAISQKIIQYRGNGVELTREEALDEILADSTYEIIQSQEFIDELCRENRSLAQSVLDAIRNVIDKLRAMIAEGQGFAPKYNESLLSELDILKDAAKLWTDGLMVAAQNRAAVGVNETSKGKYSIEQDSTGKDVVVVQEDIFRGREGEKRKKVVTEYLKNHIGDMFTMIENGKNVYLGKDLPNEYNHSKTTERLGKEKRFAKQKATPGIGEMVEIATNERWESPVHKEKHKVDAKYGFYKYDTRFAVKDRSGDYEVYDAELVIRHDADSKLYLYDVQGIKKDTAKVRFPLEKSQPDLLSEESKATTNGTSINSISETEENDKKFSFNENIFEKSQEAEGRQQSDIKDSEGKYISNQQADYFRDSKIRNENGDLLVLYHQTDSDFNIFDTRREGAGARDNGTPYGIFLKPTSKDIGLNGKKQMALYANITNPLKARNRAELDRVLKSDKDYAEVREELDNLDATYGKKFDEAKKAFDDFITTWGKDNPDAGRSDIYNDPEFDKVYEAEDTIVEEWTAKADELSAKCKEMINAYLNKEGYDGIVLEEDTGSFGRSTRAYIALDPQQVKKTDNLSPTTDPDIRFSFAGDNALNADNEMLKKAKEMYNDFESSETIRKETGWHLGTDGKWRFEIDDSQMKVFTSGDALFRKEHPEYTRLQELYDKFWDGTITDAEQKEFTDLNKTWGGELARLRTRLQRGNARLADIIQHDVLFENYPQLEDVRIKLVDLDRATGAYAVDGSEIMIDEDLFRNEYQEAKRDGTLIHEIQHAIQDIEGFAMGSNFDMINAAISATEDEVRAADKYYESAADDLLDALDEAGYFNKYGEDIDITSEVELSRIRDEYRDTDPDIEELVDELEDSQKDLQESQNKLRELRNMSPAEFYKYAAGEVEARDTANRLNYGEGERRATRPDIDSPSIQVEDYLGKYDGGSYSIPDYSKKEYNRYGWAVANELLSREEMAVFQKQVGDKARGDLYKVREGLHIIPTGENGLRNVLVYTDGNFERPSIARIVRINLDDGTDIEAVTEDIYNEEQQATGEPVGTYKDEGILDSFEAGDYDYAEWKRRRKAQSNRTIFEDRAGEQDGRGSDRESQTDSEEIKYSLPDESNVLDYINESEGEFYDVPPMRYYEIRQKQVKLQTYDELQKLCEKLKADKKLTRGKVLDKSSVTEQMNDLVRCLMTYSESYSLRGNPRRVKSELVKFAADKASIIFRAIKNGDYTTAMNTAYLAASDIVESLDFVDDANFYEYKELRDYLRTTRMVISEEDMSSIPDFTEFKRDQFGRLRIVKENGISVDQVYGELCEMYPELFDTEITNPADQLMKIADVRESLEPYDMMLAAEETEQLKKQTAQDLMEISALGKPWKSWADKKKEDYDARLKLVKTRHQEAVREIRRKERARADEKIAAEKEKAKQKIQQEKQRSSEKLQEEKQKSREKLQQERVKSQEKVQAEKDKARAKEAKRKTLRERAKSFGRIKKNYDWLCERLVKPTDDKHIPHAFTEAVADLLMCFDLQTERSKQLQEKRGYKAQTTIKADELRNRISRVKERFAELAPEDDTGIFEYDGYVFDLIDSLEKKLDGKESIDTLSDEDLVAIDILLKSVVHNINNYNKFFNENINAGIDEIGKGVIESADAKIKARGKNKVERGGTVGDLLNESNITSRDLFERMGGGMETMYMGLRSGFDKHINNITELREFFEDLFKGYHKKKKPGSKIQRWRNSKGLKTVRLESGEDIKISVAQIMSLYCSSKREQALGHILEGGIVLTEVKRAGKFREAVRGKRGLPGTSTKITYNDVLNIISQLTSEQRSMADKLQGFLNGRAAEWGNEASMKMYGYEKFTEKDYFPIKSSRTWLASNAETVNPKEKIRNFGFTKNTVQGANNTIVIDDIFTVFADHVNKMSQYNALAPAIADFMKVYNYTDKSAGGLTVKGKISDAWGRRYQRYIERFMADIQSNFDMKTEGIGRFMAKSLANYKRAAIGFNLRVAVQQPTAIARAFLLINPVYFVSKNHTPSVLKKMMRKDTEYKDMIDHCPIARWKSWGNTQVDMARDIDAIMMNEEWTRADLISMEIYGVLDNYTWSKIWGAVRAETKAKHKDVEVDSEEFYRICNERASEIFDKTQVVDSVFHRSQAMRNTDAMSKTLTSFMAEPTRTYNMMKSAYGDAVECWQNKHKVKAVGKFIGASNVFLINAAAVSAAAAVADALRGKQPGDDDDEDKEGFDLWLANAIANFWDNANPLSMIPIVKDIWSFKDGWGSSNMGLEGFAQVMESGQAILDKIGGGSDKEWNELMRDFAEGMGYVTGRPVKNILREYDVIQTKLMSAFAAEAGGEDTASKGKEWINSTLDKLSGKTGKSDENEKGGSGSDRGIVDKLVGKMDIEDGTTLDNVLNKVGLNLTDEERAAREKKKMLSDVESQISGLTGDEKNEKLWKVVTKNYTNYVNDGNIDELKRMRSTLKEFDGDVDKFDKSVLSKIQTAYKKNIGEKGDPDKLQIYRDYLKDRGYTDGKISQEIIAKSDTAKEYQKALCLNDEEAAGKYLSELSLAGLTYESYSLLFDNRSKAIKGADYSSGEFAFPVNGEITSGFGGRQSPGGIGSTDHKGIDIGVVTGTSVAAADGGKVSLAGWNGGYGNCVIIDHGNGRQTLYGHLEGYTVQAGDVVGKGQEIGKSGSTGNSTGPHLHFGVKEGGRFVDPMSYFR
ncbi:MAG: peptidoglycan DD-metalloendopeptidase family protein [Anaerovoracaceae bacterium]